MGCNYILALNFRMLCISSNLPLGDKEYKNDPLLKKIEEFLAIKKMSDTIIKIF